MICTGMLMLMLMRLWVMGDAKAHTLYHEIFMHKR